MSAIEPHDVQGGLVHVVFADDTSAFGMDRGLFVVTPRESVRRVARARTQQQVREEFAAWLELGGLCSGRITALAAAFRARQVHFSGTHADDDGDLVCLDRPPLQVGRATIDGQTVPIERGTSADEFSPSEIRRAVAIVRAQRPLVDAELVEELLPTFNTSWAEGALLSPDEFISRMRARALRIVRDDTTAREAQVNATIQYSAGGLFGGHGVHVDCWTDAPPRAAIR